MALPCGSPRLQRWPRCSEKVALSVAPGTSLVCSSAFLLPWLLSGQESLAQTAPDWHALAHSALSGRWGPLTFLAHDPTDESRHLAPCSVCGSPSLAACNLTEVLVHLFSYSFPLFTGLEFIHQLSSFLVSLKGLP